MCCRRFNDDNAGAEGIVVCLVVTSSARLGNERRNELLGEIGRYKVRSQDKLVTVHTWSGREGK